MEKLNDVAADVVGEEASLEPEPEVFDQPLDVEGVFYIFRCLLDCRLSFGQQLLNFSAVESV